MRDLIKRTSQNTFLKVTGANGLISVAKALLIIISNKVLAIFVGATGIAMVGQLTSFTSIITQLSNGGFNQGLTRYIAERKDDRREVMEFIGTAFIVAFTVTSLTALLIVIFSGTISQKLFSTSTYISILVIFAVTLFFYNLNSLILAIVNGFQAYRKYFSINITTTVVGFVLTVTLVILFREYGALLAIVLSQSIICLFAWLYIRKEYWVKAFSFKLFDKPKLLLLLRYTAITILGSVIWPLVSIVIRTYVIRNISAEEAGLWQATRYLDNYVVSIATGSFTVYVLPKLSSINSSDMLRKELAAIYRIIIPLSLIGFTLIYLLRDIIVVILYSKEFTKVSEYLLLQMIASFFWLCKSPLMNFMLAKGMVKTFIINELIFAAFVIVLSVLLIPEYQIQGIQFTFALQSFLYLVVSVFMIRRYLKMNNIESTGIQYDPGIGHGDSV